MDVLEALLESGSNPNAKNTHNPLMTPLSLVLLRGASTTPTGAALINNVHSGSGSSQQGSTNWPAISARGLRYSADDDQELPTSSSHHEISPGTVATATTAGGGSNATRSSGKKVWIKAAALLIERGAHWDNTWRSPNGCSQLHLLLSAFPPSREDSATYRAVLKSALDFGLSPALEDDRGRNALFVLCEQMAMTPSETAPDAPRLIHLLVDSHPQHGIGGSDRTGRTIFDIVETVSHSCLHACKALLVQATATTARHSSGSYHAGSSGALLPSGASRSSSRFTSSATAASTEYGQGQGLAQKLSYGGSSGGIASMSNLRASATASTSIKGEVETKVRSGVISSSYPSRGSASSGGKGYFEDDRERGDYEEEGGSRQMQSKRSFSASGYNPVVLPRKTSGRVVSSSSER